MTNINTKYDYPESISEAAKLLDQIFPNWEKKIDLKIFNMINGNECVLGQVCGPYMEAMKNVFGIEYCSEEYTRCRSNQIFGTSASRKEWINEINYRLNKGEAHDFKWAVEQLAKGEKVRRKSWYRTSYWVKNGIKIVNEVDNSVGCENFENFTESDWELYKKPLMLTSLAGGQRFKQVGRDEIHTKVGNNSYAGITSDWKVVSWSENVKVELIN